LCSKMVLMTMPVPIIADWIIPYPGKKVKCWETLPPIKNLHKT
jgi:hypothetical protein